jgi:hypothetical protein
MSSLAEQAAALDATESQSTFLLAARLTTQARRDSLLTFVAGSNSPNSFEAVPSWFSASMESCPAHTPESDRQSKASTKKANNVAPAIKRAAIVRVRKSGVVGVLFDVTGRAH